MSPAQAITNLTANIANTNHNTTGKVVCVGRNYAAHAAELGNSIPKRPILFMKPASSICHIVEPIPAIRSNQLHGVDYAVHYETELCLRLGADLNNASKDEVMQTPNLIEAVTLGIDLTLRDLQTELKEQGYPWERAKCFDGASVLADWLPIAQVIKPVIGHEIHDTVANTSYTNVYDFGSVKYQMYLNDRLTQDGNTALMLFSVYDLLVEMSHAFSLQAGDVIMTGTPSGVGVLQPKDTVTLVLGKHRWQTQVI